MEATKEVTDIVSEKRRKGLKICIKRREILIVNRITRIEFSNLRVTLYLL
jgi:hypothetical protein